MDADSPHSIHEHPHEDEPRRYRVVVSYLSSSLRGRTVPLDQDEVTIGSSLAADIHMPPDSSPMPEPIHARLHRRGQSYQLVVEPGARVFVNGDSVEDLVLADEEVTSTVVHEACRSITAGDGFHVLAPGDVTFRAGSHVTLGSGFSVGGGATFAIEIEPALADPASSPWDRY